MIKSFLISALMAILLVELVASEITVTFEPHNETEEGTLYGSNSENLHSMVGSQSHDEEDVETFYVRSGVSDGDERLADIPATQTHSPIKESDRSQPDTISINPPRKWVQTKEATECSKCCQSNCPVHPPTYINRPVHPLFPSWDDNIGSHSPVIENDAEYINGAGGGGQVIFVTQPQQPDFHQFPDFAPLPAFTPQQPPHHPSIIYIPYQPSVPAGPIDLPGIDGQVGGHIGGGFNIGDISGGGIDDGFMGGSAHRNHEQIWRQHQQQHQLWLQQQQQQQQNRFGNLFISTSGINAIGNTGFIGPVNGGGQRPCDSKK